MGEASELDGPNNVFEAVALGVGDDFVPRGAKPTDTRPGSKAKIEAMASRVRSGQEIFVAGDPTCHRPASNAQVTQMLISMGDIHANANAERMER